MSGLETLTGVGADIAAGSHAEKGTWALLVMPARIIMLLRRGSLRRSEKNMKLKPPGVHENCES